MREALGYPPYVRMAIIRIEAPSAKAGEDFLARMEPALRRMERELPGLVRLGPVDAVVFRVRNRYRWKIQLKAAGPALISQGVSRFLENAEKAASGVKGSIRFFVDVDPIDVM